VKPAAQMQSCTVDPSATSGLISLHACSEAAVSVARTNISPTPSLSRYARQSSAETCDTAAAVVSAMSGHFLAQHREKSNSIMLHTTRDGTAL
jgi:hypothetical protein